MECEIRSCDVLTSDFCDKTAMRLAPDLRILPLGEAMVVFSERAQCLVGVNESAALVIRKLQCGITVGEIAQALISEGVTPEEANRWIEATLDALDLNGLLTPRAKPPAQLERSSGEASRVSHLAAMPPYSPVENPAVERRYRLLDTCTLIRFSMPEQAKRVDPVLGHLETEGSHEPDVVMDIHGVGREGEGVQSYIYRDGVGVDIAFGLYRLAPAVKSSLWQSAVNGHEFFLDIHAGVVGIDDKTCLLLPAAAGSGKSSLTAALTRRGFRYFSDEVALIDPHTFDVPPMPLALCVKEAGWDLISQYYPELRNAPVHERGDGKLVRYLRPPANAVAKARARVSHIVFPKYLPTAVTEIRQITSADALSRLLREALVLRQPLNGKNVGELLAWIGRLHCYTLTFSSLDAAADLVAQAVGFVARGDTTYATTHF